MKRKAIICAVSILLIFAVGLMVIRFGIPSKVSALEEYEQQILKRYGDGKEVYVEHLNEAVSAMEEYIGKNRLNLWITSYEVTSYQVTVSIAFIFTHVFSPYTNDMDSVDMK